MKTILAAAIMAVGTFLSGAALAADLPVIVDDQTMAEATSVWNGIYVGVGTTVAYNVDFAETFGFGDAVVGANMQKDAFVFGAEAYLSGWRSTLAGPGLSAGAEVRGGYLVTPDVLLYLSGGAMHFISGGNTYGQIGVGTEFKLADNLSLDVEYKYWHQLGGIYQTHSLSTSLLWHF